MPTSDGRSDVPDNRERFRAALAKLAVAVPKLVGLSKGRAGLRATSDSGHAVWKEWFDEVVVALHEVVAAAEPSAQLALDARAVLDRLAPGFDGVFRGRDRFLPWDAARTFDGPAGVRLLAVLAPSAPQQGTDGNPRQHSPEQPARRVGIGEDTPVETPNRKPARKAGKVVKRQQWLRERIAADSLWTQKAPKDQLKDLANAGFKIGRDTLRRDLGEIRLLSGPGR